MNPLTIIFSITLSILNSAYSEPHIPTAGLALATGPPSLGDSSAHYAYNRHLNYGHHYVEPVHHHVSYSTYPNNVVDLFGVIHPVPGFYGHEVSFFVLTFIMSSNFLVTLFIVFYCAFFRILGSSYT